MEPKQSYRIWFTQRSGSSLLCKALEQTNLAGFPQEFFNLGPDETLREKHGVQTYAQLQQVIWKQGTGANGVFGIKHSWETDRKGKLLAEVQQLKEWSDAQSQDQAALLADLFPNCQHIYLTRRNKLRQAVSWWKAIKDNTWHLHSNQQHQNPEAFYDENYDFAALSHLLKELNLKECATQAYFSKHQIQPLTVVYEDFIADYAGTIQRILHYLGLDTTNLEIQAPYYHQTASTRSEKWVNQFREDLQKDQGNKTW